MVPTTIQFIVSVATRMIEFRFACIVALWLGATASSTQCEQGSQRFGADCWCSAGYYSPNGRAPCIPCENSINTVVGSSTCVCNPGFVGQSGNNPCTECGEFSNTLGREPEWTMGDFANYGSFYGMPEYTTSYPGRESCVCSIGSYGVNGRSPCSLCPANSATWYWYGPMRNYYLVPAMDTCVCSPGYRNVNGGFPDDSDPCIPCPGYSSSLPGSTTCNLCQINAYRKTPDAACQACPEGTTAVEVTAAVGVTSCAKCDIGYYSPSGNSPCVPCGDGYTTTAIGQTTCWSGESLHTGDPTQYPTAAPTNSAIPSAIPSAPPTTRQTSRPTVQSTARPTYPDECLPGFYSATGFGPDCTPCPKGTTNDDYGQTSCPLCTGHHYSKTGRAPCRNCPSGQSSSPLWEQKYCVACKGYSPGCAKPHHRHHHANGTTPHLRGGGDEQEE
jgi:hypothetical protein